VGSTVRTGLVVRCSVAQADKTADRFLRTFKALVEEPLESLKSEIDVGNAMTSQWLSIISHQCRSLLTMRAREDILIVPGRVSESAEFQNTLQQTLASVNVVSDGVADIRRYVTCMFSNATSRSRLIVILQASGDDTVRSWFYQDPPPTHQANQEDLANYRHVLNSGHALISSGRFETWLQYPQQFLWLQGRGTLKSWRGTSDR
jgi:hypothetical protein